MASETRIKRLVMLDIDGTLMHGHTQTVFFHLLNQQGVMGWKTLLRVTLWFIAYKLYLVGDPTEIYSRAYATLARHKPADVERLIQENFSRFQQKLFPEAYQCLHDHRLQGDQTVAISASTDPVIQPICRELGVDDFIGTKLELLPTGAFSGKIVGEAMYGRQKLHACKDYLQRTDCTYKQTLFYADHISDLALLEFVDIPICVNPDPRLRRIAKARQWEILQWGKRGQQILGL